MIFVTGAIFSINIFSEGHFVTKTENICCKWSADKKQSKSSKTLF